MRKKGRVAGLTLQCLCTNEFGVGDDDHSATIISTAAGEFLFGDEADPQTLEAYPFVKSMQRVDVRACHSANFVPIFATGPWAQRFEGFIDQPEIGQILLRWLEPQKLGMGSESDD